MKSYNLKVPRLNQNDDKVILVELKVEKGSEIQSNEIIAIVESTKATFEVETPVSGTVHGIHYNLDETIEVGDVLCEILTEDDFVEQEEDVLNDDLEDTLEEKTSGVQKEMSNSSLSLKEKLQKKKEKLTSKNLNIESKEMVLGKNLNIDKSVQIKCEKLFLGNHVSIGPNTKIFGNRISIGNHTRIGSDVIVTNSVYNGNLKIGKRSMVGSKSYLNIEKDIILGNDSCISSDCKLITHRQWHSPLHGGDFLYSDINIANNVFIAPGVVITPGISVGEHSTVLANSSLINNVGKRVIVGGVPAKVIKSTNRAMIDISIDKKWEILKGIICGFDEMKMFFNYNLDIENGERKGCYNITFSDQQNNLIEIGVCKDIGSFTKSDFIILLDGNLPESQYGIELSTLKMKNNPNTNDDFYLILYNAFFYSGVHLKMNES
tara:strand:- start:3999 stop:5300 length:1302 start_codon:yes stop_codon:yes gene_type:complete